MAEGTDRPRDEERRDESHREPGEVPPQSSATATASTTSPPPEEPPRLRDEEDGSHSGPAIAVGFLAVLLLLGLGVWWWTKDQRPTLATAPAVAPSASPAPGTLSSIDQKLGETNAHLSDIRDRLKKPLETVDPPNAPPRRVKVMNKGRQEAIPVEEINPCPDCRLKPKAAATPPKPKIEAPAKTAPPVRAEPPLVYPEPRELPTRASLPEAPAPAITSLPMGEPYVKR